MADPDVYLAVPLDEEEEMVNPAVRVSVQVFSVDTSTELIDEDEGVTTLYIDRDKAMTLALEILEQVRDNPGEAVEVKLNAKVQIDEFQCERLTEAEAGVVHARYLERMEEL